MLAVRVRYRQGLASQSGSESWAGGSNSTGQALTGECIGWVLSRERGESGGARVSLILEGKTAERGKASAKQAPRGRRPQACAETYCAEPGRAHRRPQRKTKLWAVSGSQ